MTAARLQAVRSACASRNLGALVISHLPHVRYLTGFSGSNALVIVTPSSCWLATDGRYAEQVKTEVRGARTTIAKAALAPALAPHLRLSKGARIGYDPDTTSVAALARLKSAFPGRRLVAVGGIIDRIAAVKDASEIASLRAAIAISEKIFPKVLDLVKPGVTETEIAAKITYWHRVYGSEGDAFEPIVASGVRGALPHAHATDKKIRKGELVTIDFGCRVNGYCSDITRTVAVGTPSPRLRRMYDAVLRSEIAALAMMKAGVANRAVDAEARRVLKGYGLHKAFIHALGHGVGLQIHEPLRLGPLSTETLHEGNVVTVEPGVYLGGVGGVRIEDDVVVRPHGIDMLTSLPKELLIL